MPNSIRKHYLCLALLLLTARTAGAAIGPGRNVVSLIDKADLVVMGTVSYVSETGRTMIDTPTNLGRVSARVMSGSMQVDRTLKGPEVTTVEFQFHLIEQLISYRGVEPSTYRIVFFKRHGDHYEFVSPYDPSIVAAPLDQVRRGSALDMVIDALAGVLRSPDTADRKRQAIFALRDINTTAVVPALMIGFTDTNESVRLTAAAGLLAAGNVSALPTAEEAFLRPDLSRSAEVLNLRAAIANGVKDPAAVPALVRLLSGGDTEMRRATTSALGHTKSPTAIAALGRALYDVDFDVRLNAARGLAGITQQAEWSPSPYGFRANEEPYLAHWKDWVARR
jgi:hypothetical protein